MGVIHRLGLAVYFIVVYNVYQVGKSGKVVNNNFYKKYAHRRIHTHNR